MPREFSRPQRVADFLRRELAGLIQFEMRDPRIGMVSISEVEVSRDLNYAKVYVTVLGKDSAGESKESVEALNKAAGFLRSKISQVVQMRTTPRLSFFYDSSIKRGTDLSALIDKAVKSDESHHDSDPLGNEE